MTKSSLLALVLMTQVAVAGMLGNSPPSRAVEYARDIAVGSVQVIRAGGLQVRFTPQTVLKGCMRPGSTYIVDYPDIKNRINYPQVIPRIAESAESKSAVMLLGNLQPDGRTLMPESMEGALWPRDNTHARHQTPGTLNECIIFVKALLANPKLKLKIVKGQEMLPEGYTLPSGASDASPPKNIKDRDNVLMYLPPEAAVARAGEIAIGTMKVDREQDLQLHFTVRTALKGGIQTGITYRVDYTPHHSPYRIAYLPQIAAAAEGKPAVILLGRLQPDGKTFEPEGLDSAVWPRSSKWGGVFQTPDTLEECITFIKALVEKPDLKLKFVNDRQMLPDGYTLPSASSGAIKSDAPSPATPKVP